MKTIIYMRTILTLLAIATCITASAHSAKFSSFTYTGNDDYYNMPPLQSQSEFYNPILPGWYSDPSICRIGEEYCMVTSTFGYFPGIRSSTPATSPIDAGQAMSSTTTAR